MQAGRGFAVVASEVKNLANQAKHATDTISKEIDLLNGVASEVVGSLMAIKSAIASVNEFVTSTAAAVEEQSIVTQDMSTCRRLPLSSRPDRNRNGSEF